MWRNQTGNDLEASFLTGKFPICWETPCQLPKEKSNQRCYPAVIPVATKILHLMTAFHSWHSKIYDLITYNAFSSSASYHVLTVLVLF